MGLGTRSGALLCVALLAACSRRASVPPAAETERTPEAAYAAVRQQEAAIRTLRARFSATVRRGRQTRAADGVLVVKKPDRFRVRLLSPFGLTVFDYTSWDAHDRMELPLEGKLFRDAEIAEHAPFSPADMREVFLGSGGDDTARCTVQGGALETVVDCRDREGTLARLIRIQTATQRIEQQVRLQSGQPELVMDFADYRRVERMELPFKIALTYPDQAVHLEITVRSYEVNPSLPDSLFDAPAAGGGSS
jgi:outer membrane biogenesis lipoprotein LolB